MNEIPVIRKVVLNRWCIGCGACAGLCPHGRLEMRFNKFGEYTPFELQNNHCGKNCTLCYQVCPAHGHTRNETDIGRNLYGEIPGIGYKEETGYYYSAYVGYSKVGNHRLKGSSGGLATWTLEKLLETGKVDAVAAVGRTEHGGKLFEYKMCRKPNEVRDCSGSVYYPNELSSIIQYILRNKARYAIIGLPCVCKAIRLAQEVSPKLRERITHVFGLVCGRLATKYFVEYLVAKGGGDPYHVRSFLFRQKTEKSAKESYGSCAFECDGINQLKGYTNYSLEWGRAYFKPYGCFYCDDIFAECADATFMDAWLEPYSSSPLGHSIILNRNLSIEKLLREEKDLKITNIDISDVINSQKRVVCLKRQRIFIYIKLAKKKNKETPLIRRNLIKPIGNPIRKKIEENMMNISEWSGYWWHKSDKDISVLSQRLKPYLSRLKYYHYAELLLSMQFFRAIKKRIQELF